MKSLNDELNELLSTMDIPEFRMNDLRWISRNIRFQNSGPDVDRVLAIITKLNEVVI